MAPGHRVNSAVLLRPRENSLPIVAVFATCPALPKDTSAKCLPESMQVQFDGLRSHATNFARHLPPAA